MLAPWAILHQVLSGRRSGDDAVALALAAAALATAITCFGFAVRLYRRKQTGVALLLFLAGGVLLFTCLGISALVFVSQFAWH